MCVCVGRFYFSISCVVDDPVSWAGNWPKSEPLPVRNFGNEVERLWGLKIRRVWTHLVLEVNWN